LSHIGGHLMIQDNDSLSGLTGLANVEHLGGGLKITDNLMLQNLNSMTDLHSLGTAIATECGMLPSNANFNDPDCRGLEISANPALQNVTGLQNLRAVIGHVVIESNPALSSCSALNPLLNAVDDASPGPGPGVTGLIPDVNGLVSVTNNHASCAQVPLETTVTSEYCMPEFIMLTSQAAINSFQVNHQSQPGIPCSKVIGTLTVQDWFFNQTISNLDGLSSLTLVGGGLLLLTNSQMLTNVNGLANITRVGQSVEIRSNFKLDNLAGLAGISHIGGDLIVADHPILTSLQGFSELIHLGGDLSITENDTLQHCSSLVKLLDKIDHGTSGPGFPPIPDMGGAALLEGNTLGCNSVKRILNPDLINSSGFESD